jgi:hypothetical protein
LITMAVQIGALNAKDVFSYKAPTDAMFNALDRQAEAGTVDDVTVYSEAFNGRVLDSQEDVRRRFEHRGYETFCFDYRDKGQPDDPHWGMVVIKQALLTRVPVPEVARFGDRNGVLATVKDPKTNIDVEIAAAHLTAHSARRRRAMMRTLVETAIGPAKEHGDPLVLAGVINSVPWGASEGRDLRWALPLWPAMRLVAATPGRPPKKGIRRKASLGHRAISMAIDGVADRLDEEGLRSVDPSRVPTVGSLRLDDIRVMRVRVLGQGVMERDVETDQDNLLPDSRRVWAKVEPIQL